MDYPVRDSAGNIIVPGGASGPRTPAVVYDAGMLSAINLDLMSGVINGWVDVSECLELAIQVVGSAGISAGAITIEQTNDPAFPALSVPVTEFNIGGGAQIVGAITIAASTSRIFLIPVVARFARVRISTAFVGGTVRAFVMGRNFDVEVRGAGAGSAHDAPIAGIPVRLGGRAVAANLPVVASNDTSDLVSTLTGVLITRPFNVPEMDWAYAPPAGGILVSADQSIAPARGASLRNYLTCVQLRNVHPTVATEVVLKDGAATVLWRGFLPAVSGWETHVFQTPLKSSLNAALNFACITTGAQVYANAQGFISP